MNDLQLKRIISKLTGVELVKVAMPALKGQATLKNRRLNWQRYQPGTHLPGDMPEYMSSELEKLTSKFAQAYMQFVDDANLNAFQSMVFIFFAQDASLKSDDLDFLQQAHYIPDQEKQELLRVANMIMKKGIPLAMSPNEFQQGEKASWNGSPTYTRLYGWAWGAHSGPLTDPGNRISKNIAPEQLNNANWMHKNVDSKNLTAVQVVTAQMGEGWGIFFQDESGELLPVVPEKFLDMMKKGGGDLAEDASFDTSVLRSGGGIDKFFGARSYNNPSVAGTFTPGSGRFYLERETDPRPRPINWKHKQNIPLADYYEGRSQFQYRNQSETNKRKFSTDPHVHRAMLRVNGTMYWQSEADPNVKFNMSEQQVRYLNIHEGQWYRLSEPGYRTFVFDNPQQQQQYEHDTQVMNRLREILRDANRIDSVASQSFQTIIVGPRFTEGNQSGEKTVPGVLPAPQNVAEEASPYRVGGEFTGKRDLWVVEKHEYPISQERHDQKKRGFYVPQNISGRGAIHNESEASTVFAAMSLATRVYQLPQHVMPAQDQLQAAQGAFDNAQKHFHNADKAVAPGLPGQGEQLALPAPEGQGEQAVVNNDQVEFGDAPAEVQNPGNLPAVRNPQQPPVQQVQVRRVEPNALGRQGKDIINRLKKLG